MPTGAPKTFERVGMLKNHGKKDKRKYKPETKKLFMFMKSVHKSMVNGGWSGRWKGVSLDRTIIKVGLLSDKF